MDMDKKINAVINRYINDECSLERAVVLAFLRCHDLRVESGYISEFLNSSEGMVNEDDVVALSEKCTLEDVINIFELAIPMEEKVVNGAVYTPKYIREYIVTETLGSIAKERSRCLCADISCGCGAFLVTLAEHLTISGSASVKDIVRNLYGVDISMASIGRAKILLSLMALLHGEALEESDLNLRIGDSLTFDFNEFEGFSSNGGFDVIVGNPPYVRSKNIGAEIKQNLSLWSTSRGGNADLYIPFFEIGLKALTEEGELGYITVNTFFKSVNARSLRHYISDLKLSFKIIDFGEQLVFRNKLAYTCITLISKVRSEGLSYSKAKLSSIQANEKIKFNTLDYSDLDNHKGWHLNTNQVLANIRTIETIGRPLGDQYVIKNGIATLANDVYIFRPIFSDEMYHHVVKDGKEYRIEKSICRDIIKPNILKGESDIPDKEEKIIYPYDLESNILPEGRLREEYPGAYGYLENFRHILDARDKGEGHYEAWYAFGRTQAISDTGLKLMFPYMTDKPHFVYTAQSDMLIYCGYAIYNESEEELLFLKRLLESNVFDYYIKNTSKPYSTGFYSYAKNYVKSFGVYPFSKKEKEYILSLRSKEEIDDYIAEAYRISI